MRRASMAFMLLLGLLLGCGKEEAPAHNPFKPLDEMINGLVDWGQKQSAESLKEMLTEGGDINRPGPWGCSALDLAIGTGKVELVDLVLSKGAKVNAPNARGEFPLHAAISMIGKKEIVDRLIAAGADVNARNQVGAAALHMATRCGGRPDLIDLLLAARSDVSAADNDGNTPLHWAIGNGELKSAQRLVAAGAKVNLANRKGETALHWACPLWDEALVPSLLAAGADANAPDGAGRTPLMLAARGGDRRVVDALLAAKADVNARDGKGWSALMFAVKRGGDDGAQQALRKTGAKEEGWTPLFDAAMRNDATGVKGAIAGGADVNAKDPAGRTPLLWAAALEASDAAVALLAVGAEVNAKDTGGFTALHGAARSGNVAMLKALLAAKADVRARDDEGKTPVHIAAESDAAGVIGLLVAAGAEVDARDAAGATPLLLAGRAGREDAIRALLDAKADVLASDNEGDSLDRVTSDILREPLITAREERLEKALEEVATLGPAAKTAMDTPEGTVRRCMRAGVTGEKEVILSCLSNPEAWKGALGANYEMMRAGLSFRKAMIAAYGKEGWLAFLKTRGFTIGAPTADEATLKEMRVAVTGDRAVVRGGADRDMVLVRKNGVWLIDETSLVPPGTVPSAMAKFLQAVTADIKDAEAKIGKPGVTPEGLNKEMGQKFMERMGISLRK